MELCPNGHSTELLLGECTHMPTVRNKALGKKEYYHNDISVGADKFAWIMKIPTSNSWYFRMWIKEEIRLRICNKNNQLKIIGYL